MPKYDKYHQNYIKQYPEIAENTELLRELKRSDRKMEYMEIDIKQQRFIQSQQTQTAYFLPSREDSYERLCEEDGRQFADQDINLEEAILRKNLYELLNGYIEKLPVEDRLLLKLRYWNGMTQAETGRVLSLSQQAVCCREKKILRKIKKILDF